MDGEKTSVYSSYMLKEMEWWQEKLPSLEEEAFRALLRVLKTPCRVLSEWEEETLAREGICAPSGPCGCGTYVRRMFYHSVDALRAVLPGFLRNYITEIRYAA